MQTARLHNSKEHLCTLEADSSDYLCSSAVSYLHLLVMVDVQEALPELDDLKGHKQGDGHQIRVQNPECDHQDDPVHKSIFVVALQDAISNGAQQIYLSTRSQANMPRLTAKPVATFSSSV